MITLIGVGHVFNIRHNIEKLISDRMPSVVCVELDKFRYQALVNNEQSEGAPLMYQLLSRFQRKMADEYGVDVGEEMLGAVDTAKKINAKVAFIDVDASFVFNRFWKSMSFAERIKFIVGAFGGIFVRKKQVERELKKFHDDSGKYLEMFGREFPTVKEELIDKRDDHMARAIREINRAHEGIVAIIGDGHIIGVSKALSDLNVEIIRLKDVRSMDETSDGSKTDSTKEVSFSYVYTDKK
jgi:pheromone shutdown protein TraB